jgi:hypothetical protein
VRFRALLPPVGLMFAVECRMQRSAGVGQFEEMIEVADNPTFSGSSN